MSNARGGLKNHEIINSLGHRLIMTIDIYDEDLAWFGGLKPHKIKMPWVFLDHGPKNDPKISKSERNEIELRSFNHSIRLDE